MKITITATIEDSIDLGHLLSIAKSQIKEAIKHNTEDRIINLEYSNVGVSHKIVIEKE